MRIRTRPKPQRKGDPALLREPAFDASIFGYFLYPVQPVIRREPSVELGSSGTVEAGRIE